MTLDSRNGDVMWNRDFGSPIVAMYMFDNDGLRKIPFNSMASETLQHLTGQLSSNEWRRRFLEHGKQQIF